MANGFTVADHFEGKEPVVQAIYDRLLKSLRQFGEVYEAPKKTSIHLDRASGFAGVYPRQKYLNLNFRTRRKIEHPRIRKVEQLSAHRFMHTVRLESEDDVDEHLLAWLIEAYELAG